MHFNLSTFSAQCLPCLQGTCAEMCQEPGGPPLSRSNSIQFHSASNAQPKQSTTQNQSTVDPSCQIWCPPAETCASKSRQIEEHIGIDLTLEEEETVAAAIRSGLSEVHPVLFLKLCADCNGFKQELRFAARSISPRLQGLTIRQPWANVRFASAMTRHAQRSDFPLSLSATSSTHTRPRTDGGGADYEPNLLCISPTRRPS